MCFTKLKHSSSGLLMAAIPQHLRRVKVSVEKGMNECQIQDHWEFSSKIYSNYFFKYKLIMTSFINLTPSCKG